MTERHCERPCSVCTDEVAPDVEAGVIYTFWVKHAICTDSTCKREVPLFKDYVIAQKTVSVRYHRDVLCPRCKKQFDWEIEFASLIADTAMMVNSSRGSAGEGGRTKCGRMRRSRRNRRGARGSIRRWRLCIAPVAMTT